MEKQLSKIGFFFAALVLWGALSSFSPLFAQTPSIIEHIRFAVWADTDAYPGTEAAASDAQAGEYDYPIARIKEMVPFLLEGLVYGWNFTYTPSDKTRGVEEYMEITPVRSDSGPSRASGTTESLSGTTGAKNGVPDANSGVPDANSGVPEALEGPQNHSAFDVKYSSIWIENNRFNCWIDYTRTKHEVQTYYLWSSIQNPTIQGRGYGDLSLGFEGIKLAAQDALKNAVRNYYRNTIKNKPKEITGRVLMRKTPLLGIDNGQYVINLDFFLECGTISEYTQF